MPQTRRPHIIVLGGFLGAGKTTAVRRLAEHLTSQGIRMAAITNDQGTNLVDTEVLRSCGIETREVSGGCFCCRFDALMDVARVFRSDVGPDVIVAEPVGSCTDLAATVAAPLRRLFGGQFSVAPLSVLVDPARARRLLGLDDGERFAADVEYIYWKQLEEADLIVVTKCDACSDDTVNELGNALADRFPSQEVIAISCHDGLNLTDWFQRILYGDQRRVRPVDVDYDVYANGESQLGWLNATLTARSDAGFDSAALLGDLAQRIRRSLSDAKAPIAHLKMTLRDDEPTGPRYASLNLVSSDAALVHGLVIDRPVHGARVLVNVRAQGAPDVLESALERAVSTTSLAAVAWVDIEAFAPSRPVPTHRLTA